MQHTKSLSPTLTLRIYISGISFKKKRNIPHKNIAPKDFHTHQWNLKSLMLLIQLGWQTHEIWEYIYRWDLKRGKKCHRIYHRDYLYANVKLFLKRKVLIKMFKQESLVSYFGPVADMSDNLELWPLLLFNHRGPDQTDQWENSFGDSPATTTRPKWMVHECFTE